MKRLVPVLAVAMVGCASIHTANEFHGVALEGDETPIESVEIENTGWSLLKCIPLGSGDPDEPNERSCRLFTNTVTLSNNVSLLRREMARVHATRVANLTSRKTEETILFILLTRNAYHTSAILLK